MEQKFDDVTLLITHYNRSNSLERLLQAFRDLHCRFNEIVVSDDCSDAHHLEKVVELKAHFEFTLVKGKTNKGLGDNINKGQRTVKTPYTLYVQEDFVPMAAFNQVFATALQIMRKEGRWDIIRFYAYGQYPYLRRYKEGFSEMRINPWNFKLGKIYAYSDHPHLRRSNFLEKFGSYIEGLKPDKAEYRMIISFLQKKGQGLFYDNYRSVFEQKNSSLEPSTWQKRSWRQSKNLLITWSRNIYRQIKYNYDIHFLRAR